MTDSAKGKQPPAAPLDEEVSETAIEKETSDELGGQPDPNAPCPLLVRATVNLDGLTVGNVAWINPCDPDADYARMCLENRLVVPVDPQPAAAGEPQQAAEAE